MRRWRRCNARPAEMRPKLRKATNARSEQFNMSPNSNLQVEPPPFTECVPEGQNVRQSPADSRRMAGRLQELINRVQAQPNPAARALLRECLQTLLGFYGDGLARMTAAMKVQRRPDGAARMARQILEGT